jgi:hypothetical protein
MTKLTGDLTGRRLDAKLQASPSEVDERTKRAALEEAMDDSLRMSFPASDPPAWGCLRIRDS